MCRQECHQSFQIDKALKQFDCYCNHRINIKNVILQAEIRFWKEEENNFEMVDQFVTCLKDKVTSLE